MKPAALEPVTCPYPSKAIRTGVCGALRGVRALSLLLALSVPGLATAAGNAQSDVDSALADPVVEVVHYPVRAATARELHEALGARSPIASAGLTRLDLELRWTMRERPDGLFEITSTTVREKIQVMLPRWANRAEAPRCLRQQWDDAMRALRRHEATHVRIYRDVVPRLKQALARIDAQPNEEALSQRVGDARRRVLADNERRHREFDQRTDYGRATGVAFGPCTAPET